MLKNKSIPITIVWSKENEKKKIDGLDQQND